MNRLHSKYIIIGAGLSGLTSAYELLKHGEDDFVILEARDRIGGRIVTKDSIDLGPAWFQNYHTHLNQLLKEVGLKYFSQYGKGKSILVHSAVNPPHYFEIDSNEPKANRIVGGSLALIEKLAEKVKQKIKLNADVTKITEKNGGLAVETTSDNFSVGKIIIALPPKLACQFDFNLELPENLIKEMADTHTWMGNAIKLGISYKAPFWRNKDFSGTLISQISPVVELYDHSNVSGTEFSLMGFVNESLKTEKNRF